MQNERRRIVSEGRPHFFSYHTYRSQEQGMVGRRLFRQTLNPQTASRVVRYWLQRFGLLIVIIVGLVSLFNILRLTSDPKILPLESNQAAFLHNTSTYQVAAQKLFSSSLLNSNKLTVDTVAIVAKLKRQFPELAEVSIKLPLTGHRPIVYLKPTTPILALSTGTSRGAYIVDETGRALSFVGNSTAERLRLVSVRDTTGAPVKVGQLALSGDTVSFVRLLLFQLSQKGLLASTFVLPAGKSELDMYVSGQTYFVKFNLVAGSVDQQVGTYLAMRHYLQGKGVTPSQYVDVRVEGRAYYL